MRHNCKDMISRVILAIDGELTDDQEKAFMAEINNCDCCLENYDIEKSFKEFLGKKINQKCVDTKLIDSIRNNLGANHAP